MNNINLVNKSIILAIPENFGLPEIFKENIEFIGMKAYSLPHVQEIDRISFLDYLKHVFLKFFKNDKSYKLLAKERKRINRKKKISLAFLDTIEIKTDFALVLRPDLLDDSVIEKIKTKTHKMIGYQWDGMNRYPNVFAKLKYFDHFFVFDKNDLNLNSKFKLTTNFYFDHLLSTKQTKTINDIFFLGSHIENRMKSLVEISSFLRKKGFKLDINVVGSPNQFMIKNPSSGITHTNKIFHFHQNYQGVQNAKVLLDLLNNVHTGMSLRVFEAIGLRKKLITDNVEIEKYDFYNPNNIFIINRNKLEELIDFMRTPYEDLPDHIYKKYSFNNWLQNILSAN